MQRPSRGLQRPPKGFPVTRVKKRGRTCGDFDSLALPLVSRNSVPARSSSKYFPVKRPSKGLQRRSKDVHLKAFQNNVHLEAFLSRESRGRVAPAVISTALRCHLSAATTSPRLKRRNREYLRGGEENIETMQDGPLNFPLDGSRWITNSRYNCQQAARWTACQPRQCRHA